MKFISKEQLTKVVTDLPLLKTSSIFIRFGFFLLGVFLFFSIAGFLALLILNVSGDHFEFLVYLIAIMGLITSEILAKNFYYSHGLDDAFVLAWQGAICAAVGMSTDSLVPVYTVLFAVGLFSCIRYVNTISALLSGIGLVGFFFTLITEFGVVSNIYLPFVGLILALLIYYVFYRLNSNVKNLIYREALDLTKIFSLILAYASLNYMVVRELSISLIGIEVKEGSDIPLAFLFYGFTFFIPLAYIYFSLQKKDKTILAIGLLTLAYSFFTIRFYYSLMPVETALVLAGLILFGISFFAIKKLQHKTSGITFQPDRDSNSNFILNAQALIINSQISTKPMMDDSNMPFGGGGFSGGGSGNSF